MFPGGAVAVRLSFQIEGSIAKFLKGLGVRNSDLASSCTRKNF
jgi:hypothetical protein